MYLPGASGLGKLTNPPRLCWWFVVVVAKVVAKALAKVVAKVVDKVVDKMWPRCSAARWWTWRLTLCQSQQAGFGDSRVTSTIGLLRIKASTVNFQ